MFRATGVVFLLASDVKQVVVLCDLGKISEQELKDLCLAVLNRSVEKDFLRFSFDQKFELLKTF